MSWSPLTGCGVSRIELDTLPQSCLRFRAPFFRPLFHKTLAMSNKLIPGGLWIARSRGSFRYVSVDYGAEVGGVRPLSHQSVLLLVVLRPGIFSVSRLFLALCCPQSQHKEISRLFLFFFPTSCSFFYRLPPPLVSDSLPVVYFLVFRSRSKQDKR